MRWTAMLAIGLAWCAPGMAMGQGRAPLREVAIGKPVSWSPQGATSRASYTADGVEAAISAAPCATGGSCTDDIVAQVSISVDGARVARLSSAATHQPLTLTFVPLTRNARPSVMLTSYTGGAHCCTDVKVATPLGEGWASVDLGQWDGDAFGTPRDVSGDGIADFVGVDNAFLYAFGCYACSYAPPKVLDIRQGRAVDVSAEPAFRPLFARDLARVRSKCLAHDNPACAAYAADAARLGRFDAAWREVLASYRRDDPDATMWQTGCRVAARDRPCPPAQTTHFSSFPDALKTFLHANGYLR